ncbi:PREDICTED: transmembrane protein 89 [Bison bison bison]|nr:PREDICTED: transmembrane protein 89 [Bison bison bison]
MVPGRTAPPESHGPSRNLLPRLLPRGRGVCLLPGAQVPALALAAAMLHIQSFLPWLLLLTMPMCTHAWSRPMWYQVGLDLQPWGCQPSSLEGCESSLGCPGYWMGLGTNRIYPVAGVTVTTTMMLMLSRALMQRRRSQASKSEHPQLAAHPCTTWKRRGPISDRALLLGVLHMLDSLLLHIECHLQRLAAQQRSQIKGTPAQTG